MKKLYEIMLMVFAGAVSGGLTATYLFKNTDLGIFAIYWVLVTLGTVTAVIAVYIFEVKIGFTR
ncbi:MAG: hypothetical protein ABEK59_13305 [Halobacteria archaeon]